MKSSSSNYALVTGAGSGLGKAIAFELARKGHNVILVSRPGENLAQLGEELKKENTIKSVCFEIDLSDLHSLEHFAKTLLSPYYINVLINNAGKGGTARYGDVSSAYINDILDINIRAVALLTLWLLPKLKEHKKSYILNVSSMVSFSPVAYKTVYPASKAFVYFFSRGLYQELKHSGVFVGVIHPGPMKTNAEICRRMDRQGWLTKLWHMTPEETAKIAFRQLFKNDKLILPGMANKFNWLFSRIIPIWIRLPMISRIIKKEVNIVN